MVGPAVSEMRAGSACSTTGVRSSSTIRPLAVSVAVTVALVAETLRLTTSVSSASSTASSTVGTENVCTSPALPPNRSVRVTAR